MFNIIVFFLLRTIALSIALFSETVWAGEKEGKVEGDLRKESVFGNVEGKLSTFFSHEEQLALRESLRGLRATTSQPASIAPRKSANGTPLRARAASVPSLPPVMILAPSNLVGDGVGGCMPPSLAEIYSTIGYPGPFIEDDNPPPPVAIPRRHSLPDVKIPKKAAGSCLSCIIL